MRSLDEEKERQVGGHRCVRAPGCVVLFQTGDICRRRGEEEEEVVEERRNKEKDRCGKKLLKKV